MDKEQLQELLKTTYLEIELLRKQNQLMSARLEMFDAVKMMLETDINHPRFAADHQDLLYEIEKFSDSLNREGPLFE